MYVACLFLLPVICSIINYVSANDRFFLCVRRILNEGKEQIKAFKQQPTKKKCKYFWEQTNKPDPNRSLIFFSAWQRHPWELGFSELKLDVHISHLFRILELMAGDTKPSLMFKQLLTGNSGGSGIGSGNEINLVREVVSFLKVCATQATNGKSLT